MTKNRLVLTLVTTCIISTFFLYCKKENSGGATPPPATDPAITVDVSQPTATISSMAGFIHGINSTEPDISVVTDLKPAYWRAGTLMSTIYPRISQLSATPIMVVSDPY